MNALAKAPLSSIAPLTGRPVEALVSELKNAGVNVSGPDATIASAAGSSREAQGRAIAVLFGGGARD